MMKRTLCLLFLSAMILTMTGCAALFDTEYSVTEPYQAESVSVEETGENAAVGSISNYASLKRAIEYLVSQHVESAELQFQNYDGSISQDISTACWEVKSSSAIGAFAVDYMSYDLSRIVSVYQAELYITYKRSADQMSALETVPNFTVFTDKLDQAIRENRTYLVLETGIASITADIVREKVREAYYADPLACPVMPAAEVAIFPESGVSRIFEITLSYGADGQTLAAMGEALGTAVEEMVLETAPAGWTEETFLPRDRAEALYAYVRNNCLWDAAVGSTAWDALVNGRADSEGVAMAYMAGCQALGLDCTVVPGRLNGEDHVWNLVTIGSMTYHVDVTNGAVFLADDEMLLSAGYWWDTSLYPACAMTYEETVAAMASMEPAAL